MFNIISLTLAWRIKEGSLKLSYKRNSGWHRVWFYPTQVSICENRREFAMTYSSQEIQFHQIDIPSICLPLAISLHEIENIHKSTSLPSLWVHCLGIPRVNRANMGTTKSSCLLFYLFQIWLYKCWLYICLLPLVKEYWQQGDITCLPNYHTSNLLTLGSQISGVHVMSWGAPFGSL